MNVALTKHRQRAIRALQSAHVQERTCECHGVPSDQCPARRPPAILIAAIVLLVLVGFALDLHKVVAGLV